MSEESAGERQKKALDSAKKRIMSLERFLEIKCPARMKDLLAQWQYETGQSPRKTREYLDAIKSTGKIKFYENGEDDWWVRFVKDTGESKFRQQTQVIEESSESATDYMKRRNEEKDAEELRELRRKLGLLSKQQERGFNVE